MASVAREHGVNANQVFYWRKQHQAGQLGERREQSSSVRLLPVSVESDEPLEAKSAQSEGVAVKGEMKGVLRHFW